MPPFLHWQARFLPMKSSGFPPENPYGGDFATIAGTYNEADEVKIQFGRGMLPKKVEEVFYIGKLVFFQ